MKLITHADDDGFCAADANALGQPIAHFAIAN
jgi:hypothetical protein